MVTEREMWARGGCCAACGELSDSLRLAHTVASVWWGVCPKCIGDGRRYRVCAACGAVRDRAIMERHSDGRERCLRELSPDCWALDFAAAYAAAGGSDA